MSTQKDASRSEADSDRSEVTISEIGSGDAEFVRELRQRLGVVADPDYQDPARRDPSALDVTLMIGFTVATVVGGAIWGLLA